MGSIYIHAGMPKAGSSSLQAWLKRNADVLKREAGIQLLVPALGSAGCGASLAEAVQLKPYREGPVNLKGMLHAYLSSAEHAELRRDFVDRVFAALDEAAHVYGAILLSSEGLAHPLRMFDENWLQNYEWLTSKHEVVIGYYVRPQDITLESAWRQWGFRSGVSSPAQYLQQRAKQLDYWGTLEGIRSRVPSLRFVVRPFVPSALDCGGISSDFCNWIIGREPFGNDGTVDWENRGLPLEVVNVLSRLDMSSFWNGPHDRRGLERVKEIFGTYAYSASEQVEESRDLLRRYCWHRFENGNAKLIKELGWKMDNLVHKPPETDKAADIMLIDELWRPLLGDDEAGIISCLLKGC